MSGEQELQGTTKKQTEEKNTEDSRNIETVFQELENILSDMQDPDVTLEESFQLYEKGMRDIKTCNAMLNQMEKRMQVLTEDGTLEPFDAE